MKTGTNNIMMSIKKLKRLIFLILFVITIYLIIHFIPKNYEFEYTENGYKVLEKYNKKDKIYIFTISKKDVTYKTIGQHKYSSKRKLVSNIKEYKKDSTKCISFDSEFTDRNVLCLQNNNPIDYHLAKDIIPKKYMKKVDKQKKNYKDIAINLVDDKTYYIWNYKDLIKLNKKTEDVIKLFNTDIYNIKLVTIMDKYLIVADYNQKYNFNKFLKLNLENNKIEEINVSQDISFDSKIIGTYKNCFYLVDEKNKKEYEINIKKKKVSVISKNGMGKILKDGEWQKVKVNKIITDNLRFEDSLNYTYKIENDTLYMYQKNIKSKTKVSEQKVKNIAHINNDEVYYIVDDKLYKYSFEYGEIEILTYFELNFNYENMIFVY